jgi:hypothetical protein
MNTPELHARIRYWLDQVKSPRIARATVDSFLNGANRKYFNFGVDTFERKQYIRDEMKPFVVNNFSLTPSGDVFTYPADYEHELGFAVVVNGKRVMSREISYNEQNPIFENAFSEPSEIDPSHIESDAGVTSYYGTGNTLSGGFLSYLTIPLVLYWHTTDIYAGINTLTVGNQYYVNAGSVVVNAITYNVGDDFTATTTVMTGTGTVNAIQNPQLKDSCHEELALIAAADICASLGQTVSFQLVNLTVQD